MCRPTSTPVNADGIDAIGTGLGATHGRIHPIVRGDRHRLAGISPPEYGPIELQRLSGLTKAVDDRVVDIFGSDGAKPCGHVGDEPMESQLRVRGLEGRLEIEPLAGVGHRGDGVDGR